MNKIVDFVKEETCLRIVLLDRTELVEILAHDKWSWYQKFSETIEYQLCNGWDWLSASDVSALTSDYDSTILSDETSQDAHGNYIAIGTVYWYPQYAVKNQLQELLREGEIVLTKVSEKE